MLSHRKRKAEKHLERARAGEDGLILVEGTFHTGGQTHACLEPHGCVARWDNGHLTVHTSTQSVHMLMLELAEHYKLSKKKVTVHAEFVGGAFGAKQGIQLEHTTAIQLAKQTGKSQRTKTGARLL